MSKGGEFETEMQELLREVFPRAQRISNLRGPRDYGDFINVDGWLVEAKKWNKWAIPAWIRVIYKKLRSPSSPWMLLFAADRRNLPGTFALMPAEQAIELMRMVKQAGYWHVPEDWK